MVFWRVSNLSISEVWCFIEDLSFNKLLCLKICFCNNRLTKFIENVSKCFHRINQLLSLISLATALYWENINEVLLNTNYSHTDYLAGLFIHLDTKWWIFGPWLPISLPLFIPEMEMVFFYWFYAAFSRIFYKIFFRFWTYNIWATVWIKKIVDFNTRN